MVHPMIIMIIYETPIIKYIKHLFKKNKNSTT
jgi:hypothetical protein